MRIVLDLVIDLKKNSSSNFTTETIKKNANDNNCFSINTYYESEGINKSFLANNLVLQISFQEEQNYEINKFINFIKKNKLAKIDSIYKDDHIIEFFYMSKQYKNNNNYKINKQSIKYNSLNEYLKFLNSFN